MTQSGSAVSVATSMLSSAKAFDDDMQFAARVDVPVLITADSHDQRNACARVIHATGANARGPFVPFWSHAINRGVDDLAAAARALRRQFEQARGGTLFIDDIVTLSTAAQRELLTLLDERASSRVRSNSADDPGGRPHHHGGQPSSHGRTSDVRVLRPFVLSVERPAP